MKQFTRQECDFTTEQEFRLERNLRDEDKIPMLLSVNSSYLFFIDKSEFAENSNPTVIENIKNLTLKHTEDFMLQHNAQLFNHQIDVKNFPIQKDQIRKHLSRFQRG